MPIRQRGTDPALLHDNRRFHVNTFEEMLNYYDRDGVIHIDMNSRSRIVNPKLYQFIHTLHYDPKGPTGPTIFFEGYITIALAAALAKKLGGSIDYIIDDLAV